MKRDLARRLLVIAMALVLASLCACSNGTERSIYLYSEQASDHISEENIYSSYVPFAQNVLDVIPEETVTLKVYSAFSRKKGMQTGWFSQVMKDLFNVELDFIDLTEAYTDDGKFDCDFILLKSNNKLSSYLSKNLLLDLRSSHLLDQYGGFIKDNMKYALYRSDSLSDEGLFGIPNNVAYNSDEYSDFPFHPDVRWDLYVRLGKPEIVEMDDYIELLKNMKDLNPTSDSGKEVYGATIYSKTDDYFITSVTETMEDFFGVEDFYVGFYNPKNKSFTGALDNGSEYIKCLEFYNKMYREGLLNPMSMNMNYMMVYNSYTDGQNLFCVDSGLADAYNSVEHQADKKIMAPLTFAKQVNMVRGLNPLGDEGLWCIGKNTKYPELCMAIINWMASPDGMMTTYYGPKGICWDYDENNNTVLLNPGYEALFHPNYEFEINSGFSGLFTQGEPYFNFYFWAEDTENPESNGQTYNYITWPNMSNNQRNYQIMNDWLEANHVETVEEYLNKSKFTILIPDAYVVPEKPEDIEKDISDICQIIKKGSWKAIYANTEEEFEAVIESMREDADKAGYADVVKWCRVEAYNKAGSSIYKSFG
ncbi:MAG: hypothetical protein J5811_03990 [Lachnospiraceae bacterium]|nr:hypothetical protein [Lachnospiraceae bacterium]